MHKIARQKRQRTDVKQLAAFVPRYDDLSDECSFLATDVAHVGGVLLARNWKHFRHSDLRLESVVELDQNISTVVVKFSSLRRAIAAQVVTFIRPSRDKRKQVRK